MTLITLFVDFMETILNMKIFNISLIDYLIAFTIIICIFKIINIFGNNHISRRDKKRDKKGSDHE